MTEKCTGDFKIRKVVIYYLFTFNCLQDEQEQLFSSAEQQYMVVRCRAGKAGIP